MRIPLASADTDRVPELLSMMFEAGAIPGGGGRCSPPGDGLGQVLATMAESGMVARDASGNGGLGYSLTPLGMQSISFAWRLNAFHKVLAPRDIAIKDSTVWDLLLKLEADGWEWRAMPRERPPPYVLGELKRWYSSTSHVYSEYLQALLEAPRLLEMGIADIPHGRQQTVYKNLLAGRPPPPLQRRRKHALEEDLATDLATGDGAAALEAVGDGDRVDLPSFEMAESDLDELGRHGEATAADLAEEAASAAEPLLGEATVAEPARAPLEAAPPPDGEALADELMNNPAGSWGCFRFTPVAKGEHGYYQARCPFHRRNLRTDCKQELPVLGPSQQDRRDCIRRLWFWRLSHPDFDRQRHHRSFKPLIHQCPTLNDLAASPADLWRRPDTRPATDEDLDAAAAVAEAAAVAAAQAGGANPTAGRGRRGRAGRGRSRGGGRGRALAKASPSAPAASSHPGPALSTRPTSASSSSSSCAGSRSSSSSSSSSLRSRSGSSSSD